MVLQVLNLNKSGNDSFFMDIQQINVFNSFKYRHINLCCEPALYFQILKVNVKNIVD